MKKYNVIDLFSGCGGLLDGFMHTGLYNPIASVEWEIKPAQTLANRLEKKWKIKDAKESVVYFDIQRVDELFDGYDDPKFGKNKGLTKLIGNKKIDFIIGGPPCQAYSVAGRVREKNNMKGDYRNYLFEYYLKIVSKLQPKLFVFENVPGMLSAMPDGTPIIDLIRRDMNNNGYEIINDIKKYAVLDASDFNVPQARKRVILIGLNKEYFKEKDIQKELRKFYTEILPKYKGKRKISVEEAIGDLPSCLPTFKDTRPSHITPNTNITWHVPRYHGLRDVKIFKMLAEDIESGTYKYTDSNKLKEIYNNATGSNTNVHKYHVLRKDEPSTTILAHLHKDGLRFIHYDSKQARSITVREAARLQTFDDDFDFIGSQGDAYKMIGNAVPCKFAEAIASAINDFMEEER
jgi:DNA (cytosine-5)-methyltransferase 1